MRYLTLLIKHLDAKLQIIASHRQTRKLVVASSPTSPHQHIHDAQGVPREQLMFCSNDYLGLASHPQIQTALSQGAQLWAGGSGASHLISGHTLAHERLESRLMACFASNIPQVRALSFCTGYMANMAVTTSLGDADAEFFSDALNHASLIDGMRLAKASIRRYAHANMDALRALLKTSQAKIKLIVSDTLFSMDGDLAPLAALLELAQEFDAWLILDDAHGFGVLGKYGRGALEHFDLHSERIILIGTLGKAAGLSGAFVVAHERIIEYMLQTARAYIFTTASLPAVSHALLTSIDIIESEHGQQLRANLSALQRQLRQGIRAILSRFPQLDWQLTDSDTPIQPLIVGDNQVAMSLAAQLDGAGIRVPGIRPPTVPLGQARLRITLCASHTASDVVCLLTALEEAVKTICAPLKVNLP